ncbi:hypothetical protein KFU94_50870 [Chloroflexi bacterium TSY]|nr:hypothetical protein [Chloroflexi bacterium TSY]
MNILVTGQLTYITKQVVKRLKDAGYQVRFSASEREDETAQNAAWIINGLRALSLNNPDSGYGPLSQVLQQLVPNAT